MCDACEKDKLIRARAELDVFIKGAEIDWAKEYTNDGEHFKNLLKWVGEAERNIKKYFQQIAPKIQKQIDWEKYTSKLAGEYDDDWMVSVDFVDDGYDDTFINLMLKPITQAQLAGMMALAQSAPVKIPTATLSAKITKSAQQYAGKLITNIDETTRDRINNLVNEALKEGLTQEEAAQLLNDVLNDPARAEMIAHTETVSAYSRGRADYANESGAIGKIWHTQSGKPCEDCSDCEGDGQVDIADGFGPGWDSPDDSHPNCYCYVEYVYPDGIEE